MFDQLKTFSRTIKRELKVYQLVLKDSRTPKRAKISLGLAVGYALLPFDLIPDFLPILGHLDDVVIIPVLVRLAMKMAPQEIVEDCRRRVWDAGEKE